MKKAFILFVCISTTFLTGCSMSPNYEKLADQVTAQAAKKLKKEHELILVGIGGQMMGDIQLMAMSFEIFHNVDIQESRKLLVQSVQTYLELINNNEKLRPYLHEYPFTAKNIRILIFPYKTTGHNVDAGCIDYIGADEGVLTYRTAVPNKFSKTILEEPYDQALKTLNESNETLKTRLIEQPHESS